jgi:hypothetical protein
MEVSKGFIGARLRVVGFVVLDVGCWDRWLSVSRMVNEECCLWIQRISRGKSELEKAEKQKWWVAGIHTPQ